MTYWPLLLVVADQGRVPEVQCPSCHTRTPSRFAGWALARGTSSNYCMACDCTDPETGRKIGALIRRGRRAILDDR